jgi:hypothetical protein
MSTITTIGYMAANMAFRAAPALTRVTVVIFEATTGEAVAVSGGAAITGYAALSRVEGGIGTWTTTVSKLQGVSFGPYAYLKALLKGTGFQAGHLNQVGAFTQIPKKVMGCVDLGGNALADATEHNQFHVVMEQFWNQYRTGAKQGEKVSNEEYLQALSDALATVKDKASGAAKFTKDQIQTLVDFARKEQKGYGYSDAGGLHPEVPRSMNLTDQ